MILGPMFAGKTTFLINKVNELLLSGVKQDEILLINHASDIRYAKNNICSHNGNKISSNSIINISDIFQLFNLEYPISNYPEYIETKIKYIFIDEGQFFNDLYKSIKQLLLNSNKINKNNKNNQSNIQIYICGLDGDFMQNPFNNSGILNLIPYSTSILKLNATCKICNNNAPFTKLITKNNLPKNDLPKNDLPNNNKNILVGGSDIYQSVCLTHLNN